jgi:hypothetical protein
LPLERFKGLPRTPNRTLLAIALEAIKFIFYIGLYLFPVYRVGIWQNQVAFDHAI